MRHILEKGTTCIFTMCCHICFLLMDGIDSSGIDNMCNMNSQNSQQMAE